MVACPNCGEDNPQHARFCWSCGAALVETARPAAEERKVVSILFVDLVGFTARSDRADPEDVRATLRPYHTRVKQEIEHFGGTVEKFIGDAVMAVFGAPVAHEDDAERGVRAALKILEAIEDLNGEHGHELAVRGAVATGEAVVSLDARPERGEGIATGDVVNTAARLQTSAPVGAVVVGESTFRATRDVIDYEELEPVSVKGKAEPVPLWRATRSRGRFGIDVERRADAPFVGREHELTLLRDAYVRALRESSLQLVTMTGEPGVGKTRLVAEFQSFVDAQREIVWWRQGRCLPYGEGITFWALGEIVKAHVGILESDRPDTARSKLRTAVESLFEDEDDREWFTNRLAPLAGAAGNDPSTSRDESFSAWQRYLEAVASIRPLVLVIEDLHWADDALIEFLDHLADWATGVPLVLLIAARPELYERHPGWGGGKRNSVTISLAPLSDDETARLVASLVGRAVLPAETQTALLERAGGNPLYAEEFVRLLSEGGAPAADAPLPETVQALIAARLDTLKPERKALIQDAAVVGKVFWAGAVAAIAEVDEREVKEALRELVRKELVRPARRASLEGQEEFAFWHVLVRDVAYQQIPRAARAEKHIAAGRWLEQIAGDRSLDHAEILVHHAEQALALSNAAGRTDTAAVETDLRRFLILSGERALPLDARKAASYLSRAVALTPAHAPGRIELIEQTASAAWDAGLRDTAEELYEEALALYRARGDVQGTGRTLSILSNLHWVAGRSDLAERALLESVEVLEQEPPGPELAVAYMRVAGSHMLAGRSREAVAAADKSLELAARFDALPRVSGSYEHRGVGRCELGDLDGLDDLREGLRLARFNGTARAVIVAHNNLGHMEWLLESPRNGLETKLEGIDYAARRGAESWWIQTETMWMNFDLGKWDQVIATADELLTLDATSDASQLPAMVPPFRALVLALRGRAREVESAPEQFLPLARRIQDPQVLVPALAVAAVIADANADPGRALALIIELEEATRPLPDWARLLHAVPLLRICVRLDELELGERLLDRPAARGARLEHALVAGRAVSAEARSRTAEAADTYAEAARRWAEYEFPFEEAHALLGQARCMSDDGSRHRANELFTRLGAVVPQAEARAVRESTG
ncbi:MAG TPA: adenylate/guanylate cyclase domain-containing protein [Gaiellaceae bacterium]|nr:adenylate/guanylate cyclase domain-containing protein [Gaiellaceae bacterium]